MQLLNSNVLDAAPIPVKAELPETHDCLIRAQAGDMDAYGELCRFYETRLLRHAVTLSGDLSLAEDLAQDSFVEAWKNLHRYNGRCQFFTWLCAILLNRYRNTVRRKRPLLFSTMTGRQREEAEHSANALPNQGLMPDEAIERSEQAALTWQCVRALPAKHQQVIYLRFFAEDSLEGIAAAAGCSVGTVKSRLFHALEKLRGMRALSTYKESAGKT